MAGMDTNPFARPYRVLTVGMVALVSLIAFEAVAVTTVMPTVARALHGLPLYALAFGGALAAGIVGLVVGGAQSDRRGPIRPLWIGTACFVAGLLVAGLAPQMWVLIAGRVAQGFGGGLLTVALYVVVGQVYPAALHPRVFAAFAGGWVVPVIVGPLLAGVVAQQVGWRWVFLGVVALTVPSLALVVPALGSLEHRPAAESAGSLRTTWALGTAIGAGLMYFGGQQRGLDALLLMAVALIVLAVCAPRLLPAGTFTARPGLPSVIGLRGLAGAAFLQADVFLPLMLTRERGFSPAAAGLTVTASGLAWFLGSWYQGRAGQKLAPERRLQLGLSLIAVGVVTAALCVTPAVPVWVCVAGWAVAGLGMGISYPALSALTLALSAPAEQGANSSALQLADSLLSSVVLAVGGSLFAILVSRSAPAAYLAGYATAEALALLGVMVAAFRLTKGVRLPAGSLRS
jgi:MFS family permease